MRRWLTGLRSWIVDVMVNGRDGIERATAEGILSGLSLAMIGVITVSSVGAMIAWQAFNSIMTATVVFAGLVVGAAFMLTGVGWIILAINEVLLLDSAATLYKAVTTRFARR